jgi:transcriptional regulator with XRE-family HTH domain
MAKVKETPYQDVGMQLKAIRERLGMTLDVVNRETRISRSYISDFERGIKLPTAKYLKYLNDRHNINMNFVFCTDGRMFRPTAEEKISTNFGKFQDEIEEILYFTSRMPHVLYALLGFFMEYKIKNKKLIDEFFEGKEKFGEDKSKA